LSGDDLAGHACMSMADTVRHTRQRWLRHAIVVSLFMAVGCGRGATDPTDAGIGGAAPALGVLRITIDGTSQDLVASAETDATTHLVTVGGEDSPLTQIFGVQTQAAVGTHSLPDSAVIAAYAKDSNFDGAFWAAYASAGSGSVTVKTINATSITGTFSFALVPYGSASGTKVVEGAFNAPLYSN
jgi:hypothetical protein